MKIKIKFSKSFEKYKTVSDDEFVVVDFEKSVSVKDALNMFMIPDNLPKLILINGRVKNEAHMLKDGDTLSIFPTMSGG
jgi:molybdopterin converting factor small subunit